MFLLKKKSLKILLFCLFIIPENAAFADINIYVAPNGRDTDSGTYLKPFKTIYRAKAKADAVRRPLDSSTGNITIFLKHGTYRLDSTLKFSASNGGNDSFFIIFQPWPGDTGAVILTGDTLLPNKWVKKKMSGGDSLWVDTIAKVKSGMWWFRELYKKGKTFKRATISTIFAVASINARDSTGKQITMNGYMPSGLEGGKRQELIIYHEWQITRAFIDSASSYGNVTTIKAHTTLGAFDNSCAMTAAGDKVQIENVRAWADSEGEWSMDSTSGVLYVKSATKPDATMVAPTLTQLIKISGSETNPVKNVLFKGLSFQHTTWDFSTSYDSLSYDTANPLHGSRSYTGFSEVFADYYALRDHHADTKFFIPPSIHCLYAKNCTFESCTFSEMGNTAIGFGAGCRDNMVTSCFISNIGGSGIVIGVPTFADETTHLCNGIYYDWPSPTTTPAGNTVSHCQISNCANQYFGCLGILIWYSANTRLSYNKVFNLPYAGITIGIMLYATPTSLKNTIVECNEIYNIFQRLTDGGGINFSGDQQGALCRNNYIHDFGKPSFAREGKDVGGIEGIFFDERSSNIFVENNKLVNTGDSPYKKNRAGTGIIFRDSMKP